MSFNTHIFCTRSISAFTIWSKKIWFSVAVFTVCGLPPSFSTPPVPPCVMSSPKLTCLAVQPNGDVILNWDLPGSFDPNFDSYHIYKSTSASGPYTVIDSIFSSAQTTYTHVGANANAAPVYYFIKARCTGYSYTPPVDTLETISLAVSNPANGTAQIVWNPLHTPTLSTSANTYTVYQEFPTGVWNQIGSKTNTNSIMLSYIDTIIICNSNINYRIQISDNSGCTSVSSVSGGVFQNTILPPIPPFDTLSVDDNNLALMSWGKSTAKDIEGYYVYKFNGLAWVIINTLLGVNNTSYSYPSSTAANASEQFRIAAFDSCNNVSALTGMYSTIYLTSTADICTRSAILNWTAYSSIGNGLSRYLIYQSTSGFSGPFTLAGSVPAGTLSYAVSGLAPATNYYFKVVAIDNSGTRTASSNRISFYSATPRLPQFLYLRSASVYGKNQINLLCHVDVSASISNYKVFKAVDLDTASPVFEQIGVIQPSSSSPITYIDSNVNTGLHRYLYKIRIVDSCGFDGIETNIAHTMLLSVRGNNSTNLNDLTWANYEEWPNGVGSYNVYRGVDNTMEFNLVANIPADSNGLNQYSDDVSNVISNEGIYNYYVEAVEQAGNIFGFTDNSKSNVCEIYQDPIIYIPNAFNPNGEFNKIFKPVISFVDFEDYKFNIFNRWGHEVFSSTDVNLGWDGTHNGHPSEIGVYVYTLQLKTSRGDYKYIKGYVSLIY